MVKAIISHPDASHNAHDFLTTVVVLSSLVAEERRQIRLAQSRVSSVADLCNLFLLLHPTQYHTRVIKKWIQPLEIKLNRVGDYQKL